MKSNFFFLKMALLSAVMALTTFVTQAAAVVVERRTQGSGTLSNNDAEQHLGFEACGNATFPCDTPINPGGMEGNSSSDLELGANRPPPNAASAEPGNGPQLIGIRWLDIGIPAGSHIVDAYIQFAVNEPDKSPPNVIASLQITGELDPLPAEYDASIAFNITDRPDTAASVDWLDIPVWAFTDINAGGACVGCGDEGPNQRTPDLSSVIQEIIDQPLWASGNPLALMVFPLTTDSNRTAHSWESGDSNGPSPPNLGPLLHIEFIPEPASLAIATMGMLGLLAVRRRRC